MLITDLQPQEVTGFETTCPAQVAGEPVYDTLRTKEQLGYSVNAAVRLTHGMLGFAVVVVSGARYLNCNGMLSPVRKQRGPLRINSDSSPMLQCLPTLL